jgi:phage FluMu protein Com
MAIEFRCTSCDKLLRVGDDAAGKHAKCPQCGTVLTIPAPAPFAAAAPPPPLPPRQPSPSASPNPYQAPQAMPSAPVTGALDLGSIFNRTLEIFKSQPVMCIVGVVLAVIASGVMQGVTNLVSSAVLRGTHSLMLFTMFSFVGWIASMAVGMWIQMGVLRMLLKIARGQEVTFNELLVTDAQLVLPFIGASLLVAISVWIGILLCIVPGVILALMFSQAQLLIVDRGVGVMDSLNTSKDITNGHKMELFVIWLVAGLGAILATLVTCGLGIVVAAPFLMLMMVVVYLTLTGQPTAEQLQPPAQ